MDKVTKVKIVPDTSFWLGAFESKVDFGKWAREEFGRVEWFLLNQVKKELEKLEKKGPVYQAKVNVAYKVIDNLKVKEIEVDEKTADKALIKLAMQEYIIATNDAALRRAIRGKGHCLFFRKNRLIEVE